jgi:hypothetical protein
LHKVEIILVFSFLCFYFSNSIQLDAHSIDGNQTQKIKLHNSPKLNGKREDEKVVEEHSVKLPTELQMNNDNDLLRRSNITKPPPTTTTATTEMFARRRKSFLKKKKRKKRKHAKQQQQQHESHQKIEAKVSDSLKKNFTSSITDNEHNYDSAATVITSSSTASTSECKWSPIRVKFNF